MAGISKHGKADNTKPNSWTWSLKVRNFWDWQRVGWAQQNYTEDMSSETLLKLACSKKLFAVLKKKALRSGQSVTASDFGSNGPRFESGRGRCVESLDKALYSHCPKEKPSH